MTANEQSRLFLMRESIGYAVIANFVRDRERAAARDHRPVCPLHPSGRALCSAAGATRGSPDHNALPSSVEETYTLIMEAFTLAESCGLPSFPDGRDDRASARGRRFAGTVPEPPRLNCEFYKTAPYCTEPESYVPHMPPIGYGQRYNITGLIHDESGFPTNSNAECERLLTRLNDKIEKNLDDTCRSEEYLTGDADVLIACFGGAALAVRAAVDMLRAEGIRCGDVSPGHSMAVPGSI